MASDLASKPIKGWWAYVEDDGEYGMNVLARTAGQARSIGAYEMGDVPFTDVRVRREPLIDGMTWGQLAGWIRPEANDANN